MTETTGSRQPDGGELYSLADVAKRCGVSRQAVYKRLHSDNQLTEQVDRLTQSDGRRKLYTAEALNLIKQAFSCNAEPPESVNRLTVSVDRLTEPVYSEVSTEVDRLTLEVDRLTLERDALRDQLERIQSAHAAELGRTEGLYKLQLNRMQEELKAADAERTRFGNAMRGQLDDLQKKLEQLREDLTAAKATAARAELERDSLLKLLDDIRAERDRIREELTEERQHSREQSDRLAQLADQAQRLQLAAMQPPAQLEDTTTEQRPTLWARLFHRNK